MATPSRRRGPLALLLVLGALVGAALLFLVGPRPLHLGAPQGDAALASEARAALGSDVGFGDISVLRIRDGQATWAGFGAATPEARYEIGSITKTFDGLLLADAASRGEVALTDPVEKYLPELAGTKAGSSTLEELVSHRAGLPAMGEIDMLGTMVEDTARRPLSAYVDTTTEELYASVRNLDTGGTRGTMVYSNVGAALLGQALTRATGSPDWETMVRTRLWQPLGMTSTQLAPVGRPASDLMQPQLANGQPNAPWTGEGYVPAGIGITSTASDMGRYAQALLDGRAPGMEALDGRWPALGGRIGLAWMAAGDPAVAWHNGGTGGTKTVLTIDRASKQAVVVLNNSAKDVTSAGFTLLGRTAPFPSPPVDLEVIPSVLLGMLTTLLLGSASLLARSRLKMLSRSAAAVGSLLQWGLLAPWEGTPAWLFGGFVGLAVVALIVIGLRWRDVPTQPEKRRWLAWPMLVFWTLWLAVSVAFAAAVAMAPPYAG